MVCRGVSDGRGRRESRISIRGRRKLQVELFEVGLVNFGIGCMYLVDFFCGILNEVMFHVGRHLI